MALIDNLVSYWSLEEASGDALDAHGSNDLTDVNTVGAATGKVSGARDFESGSTEYFSHTDNADLSTGDIDFTFNAWVQFESKGSNPTIIGKWDIGGLLREYILQYDAGSDRLRFLVSANGSSLTVLLANNFGSPSTGTWYMVTCWHDSINNLLGIAVNAGTPNTSSHSAGVYDSGAPFFIGAQSSGDTRTWDGLIDEVGFWKRVLTSDERTELYNSGSGRDYAYISGAAPTFQSAWARGSNILISPGVL